MRQAIPCGARRTEYRKSRYAVRSEQHPSGTGSASSSNVMGLVSSWLLSVLLCMGQAGTFAP